MIARKEKDGEKKKIKPKIIQYALGNPPKSVQGGARRVKAGKPRRPCQQKQSPQSIKKKKKKRVLTAKRDEKGWEVEKGLGSGFPTEECLRTETQVNEAERERHRIKNYD